MTNSLTRNHIRTSGLAVFAALMLAALLLAACSARSQSESSAPKIADEPIATSGGSLNVLTYNIHIGKSVDDKRISLRRIADVIVAASPDIVGLQEVDRFTERSGRTDQFAELQSLTSMTGVFGKSIEFQGGEYGIAILTSGEILESRHVMHPEGVESERRSFIMARIRPQAGPVVWAVNTHLGLDAQDRAAQVQAILDTVAGLDDPVIILGDLNEEPRESDGALTATLSAAGFEDGWLNAPDQVEVGINPGEDGPSYFRRPGTSQGFTFPAAAPDRRIDYIWTSRGSGLHPRKASILHTLASDHLPLLVQFDHIP